MWNNFEMETFLFEDRPAKIVYPEKPNGKLLIKTEYWDAFPEFEIEMVKRGYYLCFVKHYNRWATDEEVENTARFVKFVAEKLNIEPKCIPVGMSCGGLYAARIAIAHPEIISVMYLDAPLLNLVSLLLNDIACPPETWQELVNSWGFTRSSLLLFRDSPVDHMDVLVKHNIPVIMVVGDADVVCKYEENGIALEKYYKAHGAPIKVIKKSMCGHHPHGPQSYEPVIEFIEKYC